MNVHFRNVGIECTGMEEGGLRQRNGEEFGDEGIGMGRNW